MHRAYVYAGSNKLVAEQATDGQFYWLHTNHLGSARALTDTNGTLVYRGQFDPYGQLLTEWSATSNPNLNQKKFTGYERDAATGLDYAQARMYNSLRGRFMQADPAGLKAANQARPQTLNRYAYANNDPVNFVDPSGTCIIYWRNVSEGYGYWDTVLCNPGSSLPQPELPYEEPGGGGGGGGGSAPDYKQQLIEALENLGEGCRNFFGGREVINQRVSELRSSGLQIEDHSSIASIPNAPSGYNTVRDYWNNYQLPKFGATTATVVRFNVWEGGWTDAQKYNTIILEPAFHNPRQLNQGILSLYSNNVIAYQRGTLVHEYMHWLNNSLDLGLALKWDLYGKGYDIGDPSKAIDEFIANDCKSRPK